MRSSGSPPPDRLQRHEFTVHPTGPDLVRSPHGSELRRHLVGERAALGRRGTQGDPRRFRCRGVDRAPPGVARRRCHRSSRRRDRGRRCRPAARRTDGRGDAPFGSADDGPHPLRQSSARGAVARGGRGGEGVRSRPDGRRHRHVPQHGVPSRRPTVPGPPPSRVGRARGQGRRRRVLGPCRCRPSTVRRGASGRRRGGGTCTRPRSRNRLGGRRTRRLPWRRRAHALGDRRAVGVEGAGGARRTLRPGALDAVRRRRPVLDPRDGAPRWPGSAATGRDGRAPADPRRRLARVLLRGVRDVLGPVGRHPRADGRRRPARRRAAACRGRLQGDVHRRWCRRARRLLADRTQPALRSGDHHDRPRRRGRPDPVDQRGGGFRLAARDQRRRPRTRARVGGRRPSWRRHVEAGAELAGRRRRASGSVRVGLLALGDRR